MHYTFQYIKGLNPSSDPTTMKHGQLMHDKIIMGKNLVYEVMNSLQILKADVVAL